MLKSSPLKPFEQQEAPKFRIKSASRKQVVKKESLDLMRKTFDERNFV
jgi:hypothetical protein